MDKVRMNERSFIVLLLCSNNVFGIPTGSISLLNSPQTGSVVRLFPPTFVPSTLVRESLNVLSLGTLE